MYQCVLLHFHYTWKVDSASSKLSALAVRLCDASSRFLTASSCVPAALCTDDEHAAVCVDASEILSIALSVSFLAPFISCTLLVMVCKAAISCATSSSICLKDAVVSYTAPVCELTTVSACLAIVTTSPVLARISLTMEEICPADARH